MAVNSGRITLHCNPGADTAAHSVGMFWVGTLCWLGDEACFPRESGGATGGAGRS